MTLHPSILPPPLPPCRPSTRFYTAPMLDIKLIREQPDSVRQRLASRGAGDDTRIDELLALDEQRRKAIAEVEQLKAQRNRVSKEIGALMGQKKTTEAEAKKQETRAIGERITALDRTVAEVEQARDRLLVGVEADELPLRGHVNPLAKLLGQRRVRGEQAVLKQIGHRHHLHGSAGRLHGVGHRPAAAPAAADQSEADRVVFGGVDMRQDDSRQSGGRRDPAGIFQKLTT